MMRAPFKESQPVPGPADAPSAGTTGLRLARALLGYYLVVVAVIVLVPLRFVVPDRLGWMWVVDGPDFVANILLFVPFGFLYRLSRRLAPEAAWRALVAGMLASLAIEIVQMFLPSRFPSPLDIASNGLGAWLGALLCGAAARRLQASALVGRLSLELPLMGLVYLLVPLFWVASLSIGGNTLRLWMLALPVLFGATLLGWVQRHHFGPARASSAGGMALVAAGGVLLGTFPALASSPLGVAGLAALAAAAVLRHGVLRTDAGDRRFEVPALHNALPYYAVYLAACALVPLTEPLTPLGFAAAAGAEVRSVEILRLLHASAAFTLLGYMIAELRGRFELPFHATSQRVLLVSLPATLGTIAAGYVILGPEAGAWTARNVALWLLLLPGGAHYGAWLYHLQRDHVRALVTDRLSAGPSFSGAGRWSATSIDGAGMDDVSFRSSPRQPISPLTIEWR